MLPIVCLSNHFRNLLLDILFSYLLLYHFFVPKTPRYLVMEGNDSKALYVLERINGPEKAKKIFADIKSVTAEKTEKLFTYGVAVIVIGILLSVFQQAIGINAVLYYAPRIFEKIGGGGDGMMQTVIMGIVNITFTLVAIFTVEKLGRKPLLIIGSLVVMAPLPPSIGIKQEMRN